MDFTHFPAGFPQWMLCLVFFIASGLWAANQALKFFKAVKPKAPHPPNEQLESATTDLLRRIVALEELAGKERESASRSRAGIYHKIDEVTESLREDTAELRKEMNERFDNLPERIINLVKNMR